MVCATAFPACAAHAQPHVTVAAPPQSTSDRFNVNQSFSTNWEHLYSKHVGTGHPDITKLCVALPPPPLERAPNAPPARSAASGRPTCIATRSRPTWVTQTW